MTLPQERSAVLADATRVVANRVTAHAPSATETLIDILTMHLLGSV
jgi:hypothetical protein